MSILNYNYYYYCFFNPISFMLFLYFMQVLILSSLVVKCLWDFYLSIHLSVWPPVHALTNVIILGLACNFYKLMIFTIEWLLLKIKCLVFIACSPLHYGIWVKIVCYLFVILFKLLIYISHFTVWKWEIS